MDKHPDDFSYLPESEQNRMGRNSRVDRAVDYAWHVLITRGVPQNGYRYPLRKVAESIARKVGASTDTCEVYLREVSTGDQLDPFDREFVNVNGNDVAHLRPKHEKALKARLRQWTGGGNA